ncbi:MAG TPA: thiamine phosphate synthase [Kofleriaceae bacterium]|nr:thiamine phosphate synthase [Kofleriaceae bacterium]
MHALHVVRASLRRGLYAVLDRDDEQLARTLVGAGAQVLQIRIKPGAVDDIVRVARMARRVCNDAGAHLIVNDRIDIALAVGADGVHLGQTDIPLADACALVGTRLAIGISTHNLDQVRAAVQLAPAYIAYGPVFPTTTKATPDPVQGIPALRAAVKAAGDIPVVAIGGITPVNSRAVYGARAASICAIRAVNSAPDVAAAVRAFRGCSPWLKNTGTYGILRYGPASVHLE